MTLNIGESPSAEFPSPRGDKLQCLKLDGNFWLY